MDIFFSNPDYYDPVLIKIILNQTLQDQFIQKWYSDMEHSSRGQYYFSFKNDFGLENYLIRLSEHARVSITKLRTSNLKIPIETGRWNNIPKEDRICNLCKEALGDEFHYLFICKNIELANLREKLLPKYYVNFPNYQKLDTIEIEAIS